MFGGIQQKSHWGPGSSLLCDFFFNCILGLGVHEHNMQDSCMGTHMAVWFDAFLPFTYIWHFSPCYPSLCSPPPTVPLLGSPNRPQCVMFPSLCSCVLIVQFPLMSENMRCLVFCSCVSLLRMMVSSFIHVPTKDMNSSFFMAAWHSMVYRYHISFISLLS